jgi:FkbH-like protein
MEVAMTEKVRLIIWDLDDTFWQGTLTEGGIAYNQETHDLVIELARRGIVSSVCSKNDYDTVHALLVDKGIRDYFVLPSINWEPKGPRLARMIETFGLRPPTVLFVDDNHLNLQEALHHVPGLQVSDESIINRMATDPLFTGKDDRGLTRLAQYKSLEKRANEAASSGGDNIAFLRSSGIKVTIEFDVSAHLDRAIEMVNRTNQLNFTKRRLPENIEAARSELSAQLARTATQAGLIRVVDRYGDHGIVGFYLMDRLPNGQRRLLDFCFSCRIMSMHVEQWLYNLLGRPVLHVVGEVVSSLEDDGTVIDWITLDTGQDDGQDSASEQQIDFPPVLARGGCNLAAVTHYFSLFAPTVVSEWNFLRNGIAIRSDHSQLIRYAIEGLPDGALPVLEQLGYTEEDFRSSVFGAHITSGAIRILSIGADSEAPLYRHKETGLVIPFWMVGSSNFDLTTWTSEAFEAGIKHPEARKALSYLRENFEYIGLEDEERLGSNLDVILGSIPACNDVYLLLPNERGASPGIHANNAKLREWIRTTSNRYGCVKLVNVGSFIRDPKEIHDVNHFERMVYFRIFEHIRSSVAGSMTKPSVPVLN